MVEDGWEKGWIGTGCWNEGMNEVNWRGNSGNWAYPLSPISLQILSYVILPSSSSRQDALIGQPRESTNQTTSIHEGRMLSH
jgi:hypothetical protein